MKRRGKPHAGSAKTTRSLGVESISIPQIDTAHESGSEDGLSNASATYYLQSNFPAAKPASTFQREAIRHSPEPVVP